MTKLVLMRIAPWPAARIMAVLYLVLGIVVMPFMLIAALVSPEAAGGGRAAGLLIAFAMPFLYAFIGFLSGMIGGALYNLFARMLGGIPLTFVPEAEPALASPGTGWAGSAEDPTVR